MTTKQLLHQRPSSSLSQYKKKDANNVNERTVYSKNDGIGQTVVNTNTTVALKMVKQEQQSKQRSKRKIIVLGTPILLFMILYYYIVYSIIFNKNEEIILDEETLDILIPSAPESSSASMFMTKNAALSDTDMGYHDNIDDVESSTFLTMYGEHRAARSLASLPQWFQEYVKFNRNLRKSKDSNTKYLVLMCLPKDTCGGISDRFRGIAFDLFVAKHTNRILCIHWAKPYPLEEFLQPNLEHGIDWRCPSELSTLINIDKPARKQRFNPRNLHSHHRWFRCKGTPTLECTQGGIEKIQQSEVKYFTTDYQSKGIGNVNFANSLVQRHSYTGGNDDERSDNGGFMPEISQWQYPEMMHDIFRVMFQPVPSLAQRINHTMTELELVEKEYVSVHVRARYPVDELVEITQKKRATFEGMDATDKGKGVEFTGKAKKYFVAIIENAIQCGHLLAPDLPLYFASDHNNVTQYATSNDFQDVVLDENKNITSTGLTFRPVGLHPDRMPLHTDYITTTNATSSSITPKVQDFFNVFEDLLIMGGSKCVSHGIGSFGSFGAGLAGNKCRTVHRKSMGYVVPCPNERGIRKPIAIEASEMMFGEVPGKGEEKGKLLYDKYLL